MRKKRVLLDGAKYHVTARANHKEMLMEQDTTKQMFLEVLARAKQKFEFELDNFVIMGNHFHLIIQPLGDTSLSKIMKWILQTFAIRYNRANGLWGHFWGDRYYSWIIPTLQDFLRTFTYLDENPVRAGLAKHIFDWKWGAIGLRRTGRATWLGQPPTWLLAIFPSHKPSS